MSDLDVGVRQAFDDGGGRPPVGLDQQNPSASSGASPAFEALDLRNITEWEANDESSALTGCGPDIHLAAV
jgi:hypothetical protein